MRAPRVRATVPVTAAAAGCYYLVILTGSVAVSGPAAPGRSAYSTAATKLAARAPSAWPGAGTLAEPARADSRLRVGGPLRLTSTQPH